MVNKSILIIISALLTFFLNGCFTPECTHTQIFKYDRRGKPLKIKKKKDPPAFLMKRCPIENCKTRKIHCHNNIKYRGNPWWKKQYPDTGEGVEIHKD